MVIWLRSPSKSIPGMVSLWEWEEGVGWVEVRALDRSVPFFSKRGNGTVRRSLVLGRSAGPLPAAGGAAEVAGKFQRVEGLTQAFVPSGKRLAEPGAGEHLAVGQ